MRRALLYCGIAASGVYLAANIITPGFFPGYEWTSQTVSELSAIGAPSQWFWVAMMVPYSVLMIAFGLGIWMAADDRRALKAAAVCMILHVVFGYFWPPMHLRGDQFTLTDTLHIVWTAIVVPLMLAQITFAGIASGTKFRIYSVITVLAMVGFSSLTATQGPAVAANEPTPLIGVWERLGMAAYFIWIPILALRILRERS